MKLSPKQKNVISVLGGFLILFLLYHLPEIFQRHFQKPLLGVLELGMLLMVFAAWWIGEIQVGTGLQAYGLFSFRKYSKNLAIGLLIGFALFFSSSLFTVALNWNQLSIHISWFNLSIQVLLFSAGTLLPSLAEDLLTRGYLFAHWPDNWPKSILILLSAVIYVLNHIFRLNRPDVMLYLFVLGILLMWCLIITRSLWLTLGLHWGTNIGYQILSRILTVNSLKETGWDNYILAITYFAGILLVALLYKVNTFRHAN